MTKPADRTLADMSDALASFGAPPRDEARVLFVSDSTLRRIKEVVDLGGQYHAPFPGSAGITLCASTWGSIEIMTLDGMSEHEALFGDQDDLEYARAMRATTGRLNVEMFLHLLRSKTPHQAARRISSTTLPAVTGAALEVESARRHAMQAGEMAARSVEHATKALDAIGGITRGRQEPDPTENT